MIFYIGIWVIGVTLFNYGIVSAAENITVRGSITSYIVDSEKESHIENWLHDDQGQHYKLLELDQVKSGKVEIIGIKTDNKNTLKVLEINQINSSEANNNGI